MSLTKTEFFNFIKSFNFRELFNEMGWNNDKTSQPIVVDKETFSLQAVAEKNGFKIFTCNPQLNGLIPEYAVRKKIEIKVTKLYQEHLIIFFDNQKTEQIWQLVVRQAGKKTKFNETRWVVSQTPNLLFQRVEGIFFNLEEEDKLTIVDVKNRITENFNQNYEKVTKNFYEGFKKEHNSFYNFIIGIDDHIDAWNNTKKANEISKKNQAKQWYVSLMLNRLMFCYFIQKKGFLDNNKNYLREKLNDCKAKNEQNQFYSFYRDFLLMLFHKGLNEPVQTNSIKIEIGKIPYLNGGLFDEHELELAYKEIQIDDNAFEKLFDFFDKFQWHLDTRSTATGYDINPDVIGYIFEKYINDRAKMGAYYTKEDITDYISKNCILPYLFDETKRNHSKAFAPEADLWQMIKQSGDTYIYDAVKKGVEIPLPAEIENGIDTTTPNLIERRKEWNKPASEISALPTEIWREVVDRRRRYTDVKNKIEQGEIFVINDFITYNLNIRQFAEDTIQNTNDPEYLKQFYKALNSVTILDPTCGSGAFLFAAMNILEPLYESCIERMRAFTEDEDRQNALDKKNFKNKYKYFREVLASVQSPQHPNLSYFIYKSIILNNLYGVDIMKEAVEIAKLRLFLKLVATVDADYQKPNLGLEPLPDIDFNIRAGNTLIGFATEGELLKSIQVDENGQYKTGHENNLEYYKEECDLISRAFERYKTNQLNGETSNYTEYKDAKNDLNNRLVSLNSELNKLLFNNAKLDYEPWLSAHLPFHWFAEFYEIVSSNKGFDVIIGNPPYVEYLKVRKDYTLKNYVVQNSGNLFGFVMERAKQIISNEGYLSFIVPISVTCTQRMETVQKHIFNSNKVWLSSYGERPSKLFSGAEVLLTIFIVSPEKTLPSTNTTTFIKWKADERPILFDKLFYNKISLKPKDYSIPKIGFEVENEILKKIKHSKKSLALDLFSVGKNKIFYRIGGGRYWKIFTDFSPKFVLNGENSTSSRENHLFAKTEDEKKAIISILSSSTFYWFFVLTTNCRDLNPSDLKEFPISISDLLLKNLKALSNLSDLLMADYKRKSELKEKVSGKTGNITYQEFYPRISKPIIDEIDKVLAEHYGFTEEELDFIINYDIKYRMGKELESEEV